MSQAQVASGLDLTATSFIEQGSLLSRLPRIEATEDLWVHEISLTSPDGTDTALNDLLETLLAHKPFLNALAAKCQITLRLYVRSSRAHITYSLMPATLQKLTEVGAPRRALQPKLGRIWRVMRLAREGAFLAENPPPSRSLSKRRSIGRFWGRGRFSEEKRLSP